MGTLCVWPGCRPFVHHLSFTMLNLSLPSRTMLSQLSCRAKEHQTSGPNCLKKWLSFWRHVASICMSSLVTDTSGGAGDRVCIVLPIIEEYPGKTHWCDFYNPQLLCRASKLKNTCICAPIPDHLKMMAIALEKLVSFSHSQRKIVSRHKFTNCDYPLNLVTSRNICNHLNICDHRNMSSSCNIS